MQRKFFFVVAQCVLFQSQCNFVNALFGRNVREAAEGEFPNVVAIVRFNNQPRRLQFDLQCTGTLVTRQHVLSAEHCFTEIGSRGVEIYVGSIDLRRAVTYHLAWWLFYEQWARIVNRTLENPTNDIAITKLTEAVPEQIQPALLAPSENRRNLYGVDVVLAGWGTLRDYHPHVIHTARLRIISNEDCINRAYMILGTHINVNDRFFCTIAEPTVLTTDGDSGGPVFHGSFLLGINYGTFPRTPTPMDRRKSNIHCTVEFYREFIQQNMNI